MLKFLLAALAVSLLSACQTQEVKPQSAKTEQFDFLSNTRQLTFAGKRAGEAYFSADGKQLIFQSEREPENPFYQIYLMDLESGKTNKVSPGVGKTTCSWIHPTGRKILYSSTHLDPAAKAKQEKELEFRASGKQRRYSWDYDEHYDIFEATASGKVVKQLTKSKGYDAEGSYSPDGQWIAFASNRTAYSQSLSEADKKAFEHDPAYMMDIYIMKSDGSQVKRLTEHKGYDGGPFFSPDGQRIVWRRFSPDGHSAEIYTMNIDGSDKKQITRLNAMSWAPYYHPSGDYIIFTTNLNGYHNFELYIVDTEGKKEPVRATHLEGFDGLPVFSPDGNKVVWSAYASNKQAQVFMADWDDSLARKALGLPPQAPKLEQLSPEIKKEDIEKVITYMASSQLNGRHTGSAEEKLYTQKIADLFSEMGLKPAGDKGSYFQEFEFISGVSLGDKNQLSFESSQLKNLELNKDWTPLAFSKVGEIDPANIVFVGYGIVAPEDNGHKAYNSYEGADVSNKWVLAFRYVPEDIDPKWRTHLYRYSKLEHKTMIARGQGAKGIIFVSGPTSKVKTQLIKPKYDSASSEASIPALSVSDDVAQTLLSESPSPEKDLGQLQKLLDKGDGVKPFELGPAKLAAQVDIKHKTAKGRNVLAKLNIRGARNTVVIGAHGDHLGAGKTESSRMAESDTTDIHFGADDNASGVAGVMELAHYFANGYKTKAIKPKNNLLFAVWSGEEIGNLGSSQFTKSFLKGSSRASRGKIYPRVAGYVNMDMIGRMDKQLSVQGLGSSQEWKKLIEEVRFKHPMPLLTQDDPYLPTDSMSFYLAGVPTINFFTGAHDDYHSPRDTAEKIKYDETAKIVSLVSTVSEKLASRQKPLPYNQVERKAGGMGRGFRIFLGTIPDYANKSVKGVKLSGVIKGGPAEKAGLQGGDVIIKFAEYKIENIYDYVYALQALKPGDKTSIVVVRNGEEKNLDIVPESKD